MSGRRGISCDRLSRDIVFRLMRKNDVCLFEGVLATRNLNCFGKKLFTGKNGRV